MNKAYVFDWGDTIMRDMKDQKGPMYLWSNISEVDHAVMTLKELSRKHFCYLATNAEDSTKNDIKKALERISIDKYFTDIFCYKEIGYKKPAREYFDTVIKKIGCPANEIVMVGDSLENDVLSAIEAGMNGILFDPDNNYGHYNGEKINDLLDLLKGISD